MSFTVDRDMGQPDMAQIVLSNQDHSYSKLKVTGVVDIKVGDSGESIYKGEIVGLEPSYRGGETQKITIRAMNKMHRLLRKRKSQTFTDKTDQQILSQVVRDAGLTLDWKHEKSITYKHVYQHNQSRHGVRAHARGAHGLSRVVRRHHAPRQAAGPGEHSGIELKISQDVGSGYQLRSFTPRISSAPINKKVTVKGWNPETKELITGDYSAQNSPLGSKNAVQARAIIGGQETFTVDHPIWSKEEAARAREGPAARPDAHVHDRRGRVPRRSGVRPRQGREDHDEHRGRGDTFNGKYYVMGITHRHTRAKGKDGGFVTILRVARDAQGGS